MMLVVVAMTMRMTVNALVVDVQLEWGSESLECRIQYCSTTRLQIIATTDTFLPASSIIISQHVHVNCHTLLNIEYFVPLALLKSA